jgi:hypothetical protein
MTTLTSTLLRRTALRFDRKSRAIAVVGLAGFGAYALFFGAMAWFGEVLLCRLGCALIAAGFCYSIYSQRLVWRNPPQSDCLSFYRQRLTERRDWLRRDGHFFILSTHLGVATACLGWILAEPRRWQEATSLAFFYAGLYFAVHQLNSIEVARLQKEIDLLNA